VHTVLGKLDRSLLEWLHSHATPTGVAFFLIISQLGSPAAMTILALIGATFLIVRREWILLAGWAAAFGGNVVIDNWLKLAIRRPRPVYASAWIHHPNWSFPSGHAMGALVGYGMLAYVIVLLRQPGGRARTLIYTVATLLIVAIGVSRLYLGVHYLTDVAGGYVVGLVWLGTCICAIEIARRWQSQSSFSAKA
jgi:membrane-associated phospholipid phosphatase